MPPIGAGQEDLVQIGSSCQLEAFPSRLESGPPSRDEPWSWYLRRRFKALIRKLVRRAAAPPPVGTPVDSPPPGALKAGDLVRVRSAEDIRRTLDENGGTRGCSFALGMYRHCGKEFRVAKVVERFFDEARWRMLRARNMVLLEGVHCDGSDVPDTGGCDRMCFYFWRTEWLEKVELGERDDAGAPDALLGGPSSRAASAPERS